jgi:hypothetical protein
MSRVEPPFAPIGKSTCTGGFILRSAAFSGLPTLTAIAEENLGITRIPDVLLTNSMALFDSTTAGPPRSLLNEVAWLLSSRLIWSCIIEWTMPSRSKMSFNLVSKGNGTSLDSLSFR